MAPVRLAPSSEHLTLPLSSDPALTRATFFAQGFVLDPNGAFATTLAFTSGLRITMTD